MRLTKLCLCVSALVIVHCGSSKKPDLRMSSFELTHDNAVGWELNRPFPPGKTSRTRTATDKLTLAYASLNNRQLSQRIITHGGLRNKSLMATGAELCHPNFAHAVTSAGVDRLMIRVEGNIKPAHAKCLAQLAAPALYLALCPSDGESIEACDGDAQLRIVAANTKLAVRVRGLLVGLGDKTSWKLLSAFSKLERLVVRGKALGKADDSANACALPELRTLDLLDPSRPGDNAKIDATCLWRLQGYTGWTLPRHKPIQPTKCQLREVWIWKMTKAARELLADCAAVKLRGMRDEYDKLRRH